MNDETKLPRWARDLIEGLRHDVKDARASLAGFVAEVNDETQDALIDGIHKTSRAIGKYEDVRFLLDGSLPHQYVYVDRRGDHLDIRATNGHIIIEPTATNCVNVKVRPL